MKTQEIKKFQGQLADYTELRAQENRSFTVHFMNGQMIANNNSTESGVSARNFASGVWGFASHPQINENSIKKILSESLLNAKYLAIKSKVQKKQTQIHGSKFKIDLSTQKNKWQETEIVERLKLYDNYLLQTYPELSTRSMRISQQDFIKEIINSEGAEIYSHYARSFLILTLGIKSESGYFELRKVMGDKGQIEDTFPSFETFKSEVESLFEHLKAKSKGIHAEAGLKDVILSSALAGILAHEAVGHTTEADHVLGGSVAADALDEVVASPLVSLVDFAHTVNGVQAPMPVIVDDEGTPAEDTLIIENGILKTYMNSKESAEHFKQKATGHSRAWGFNDEPLIRMRNTAIIPGTAKLEDMISSIDDGYYLIDHSNGQADSTSEFMFGVPMGYEIKKGKLGKAILDTTISGVAFNMLKTISMLSDELTWNCSGTCGKKQPMTVGMGGPAIKCKVHIGGK